MSSESPWFRSAVSALVGAVLVEGVNVLSNPSGQTVLRVLSAATVGAIVGWFYDINRQANEAVRSALRNANEAVRSALRNLDRVGQKLDLQYAALDMLLNAGNHGEIVNILLSDSISKGFKTIAFCDENRYYQYLLKALEACDVFETIHRQAISKSYGESDATPYLAKVRSKNMTSKTRVFVIEPADVPQMIKDLDDSTVMTRYWERTGNEVRTYWISSSTYQNTYRNLPLPPDCVIFDQRLSISFDAESKTVSFDLVDETRPARALFVALREQQENRARTVFSEIPGPADK
jgi:hypothetical protein